MSPRSPCRASVGCKKVHGIPKLFMLATVFLPTSPLLPTPQMSSLPPASLMFLMYSTARTRPSRAIGSDWYRMVTWERAVAAVDKTWTAQDRRLAPSGSSTVTGGVRASEPARLLFVAGNCCLDMWMQKLYGYLERKKRRKTTPKRFKCRIL